MGPGLVISGRPGYLLDTLMSLARTHGDIPLGFLLAMSPSGTLEFAECGSTREKTDPFGSGRLAN